MRKPSHPITDVPGRHVRRPDAGRSRRPGRARPPRVNWSQTASPGIIEGAPRADQILLTGSKRHTCQSLHVTFEAGGQAQSASLLLRRAGRPDVRVDTETDTRGTLDAALRPGKAWQLAASTPSVSIGTVRGRRAGRRAANCAKQLAYRQRPHGLGRWGRGWQGRGPRSVRTAHEGGDDTARRAPSARDGPCRDRTYDLEIKSLLLYQLS